jgi:DNA-binding IclR family transcriptional regulator
MPSGSDRPSPGRALVRGLEILRLLVEAGVPMSPTELADRVGIHQSSASRILATLVEEGYVRRVSGRRFEPDFGVLTLAAAVTNLPLVRRPRDAVEAAAAQTPGALISLSVLWRGQIIYILRTEHGMETVEFWRAGFPLHQSAPAMRMLLSLPEEEAMTWLRASRARFGWVRNSEATPVDEADALRQARDLLDHDILILDGWHEPGRVGSATLIDDKADYPVALSLSATRELASDDKIRLWLLEIRRSVEKSLD